MPKLFRIEFSREEYGFVYFSADSEKDAEELLSQCERGERDIEELDDFEFKIKSGGESINTWSLEEVE